MDSFSIAHGSAAISSAKPKVGRKTQRQDLTPLPRWTGDGSSPRDLYASASIGVLALDVGNGPVPTRLVMLDGESLDAPNGIRVRSGSQLRLEQATVTTDRRLELNGGALTGRGTVTVRLSIRASSLRMARQVRHLRRRARQSAYLRFQWSPGRCAAHTDDRARSETHAGRRPPILVPARRRGATAPDGFTGSDAGNEFNVSGFDTASFVRRNCCRRLHHVHGGANCWLRLGA